jgi:hypothetical protein
MMTKKHYEQVANVIEKYLGDLEIGAAKGLLITNLADVFENDNPNFDRGKFVHACYLSKEKYAEYLKNKNKEEIYLDKAHTQLFGI